MKNSLHGHKNIQDTVEKKINELDRLIGTTQTKAQQNDLKKEKKPDI